MILGGNGLFISVLLTVCRKDWLLLKISFEFSLMAISSRSLKKSNTGESNVTLSATPLFKKVLLLWIVPE